MADDLWSIRFDLIKEWQDSNWLREPALIKIIPFCFPFEEMNVLPLVQRFYLFAGLGGTLGTRHWSKRAQSWDFCWAEALPLSLRPAAQFARLPSAGCWMLPNWAQVFGRSTGCVIWIWILWPRHVQLTGRKRFILFPPEAQCQNSGMVWTVVPNSPWFALKSH